MALNFSIFLYDQWKQLEWAIDVAKKAFDAAIADVDNLTEADYKDATMIMSVSQAA